MAQYNLQSIQPGIEKQVEKIAEKSREMKFRVDVKHFSSFGRKTAS